jgi:hypothetical protein
MHLPAEGVRIEIVVVTSHYTLEGTENLRQSPLAFRLFSSKVISYIITDEEHWRGMTNSLSVKIRFAACLLLLTVFLTTPVCAGSKSHPAKTETPTDPGYVFALAAANHFLHAWQTGDVENGMVQLSDGIRHSQNADKLEQFFSNASNRAFEITRGTGHPGRYTFPVVLVTIRGSSHVTRKFSEIALVETGKNDWVVDKLP